MWMQIGSFHSESSLRDTVSDFLSLSKTENSYKQKALCPYVWPVSSPSHTTYKECTQNDSSLVRKKWLKLWGQRLLESLLCHFYVRKYPYVLDWGNKMFFFNYSHWPPAKNVYTVPVLLVFTGHCKQNCKKSLYIQISNQWSQHLIC